MEEKKKSNVGLIVLVVILLLACIGMGTYIIIHKVRMVPQEDISTTVETENKDIDTDNNIETDNQSTNGECPLTKFDNTYVLTDTDKEEIMTSLESLNVGFTRQVVDVDTFTISAIADSGYYINVKFDTNPNTSGTYASVVKVNNKFKVLIVGSGDTADGIKRMETTLERICK